MIFFLAPLLISFSSFEIDERKNCLWVCFNSASMKQTTAGCFAYMSLKSYKRCICKSAGELVKGSSLKLTSSAIYVVKLVPEIKDGEWGNICFRRCDLVCYIFWSIWTLKLCVLLANDKLSSATRMQSFKDQIHLRSIFSSQEHIDSPLINVDLKN